MCHGKEIYVKRNMRCVYGYILDGLDVRCFWWKRLNLCVRIFFFLLHLTISSEFVYTYESSEMKGRSRNKKNQSCRKSGNHFEIIWPFILIYPGEDDAIKCIIYLNALFYFNDVTGDYFNVFFSSFPNIITLRSVKRLKRSRFYIQIETKINFVTTNVFCVCRHDLLNDYPHHKRHDFMAWIEHP